jgi:hypothetical protein
MSKKVVQTQPFYLQSGIDGTQTSIVTSVITDIYGNQITSMPAGVDFFVATCEPRSPSNQESWKITAISDLGAGQVQLTVVRKIEAQYPYAPQAGTVPHGNGAEVIITNGGLIYEEFVSKDEDSTVDAIVTFTNPKYPRMDTATPPPTDDEEFATKKYVDDIVVAGAPDASTTTKGIAKLSANPVSPTDPIAVGDNDPRVPTALQVGYIPTAGEKAALVGNNTDIAVGTGNKYITQTGLQKSAEVYAVDSVGTDSYAVTLSPIPTSYADGMTVRFKAGTANTGACTLNVNGLGAIAIKKGGSSALETGDILSGQVVTVTYDGTNFQMASASATGFTVKTGSSSKTGTDASTTQTIAHGLGKTPKVLRVFGVMTGNGLNQAIFQPFGTYDGTTTRAITLFTRNDNSNTDFSIDSTNIMSFGVNGNNPTPLAQSATVTMDDTNITLTWTRLNSGPSSTLNFIWQVEG